jgi:hypothetical protein
MFRNNFIAKGDELVKSRNSIKFVIPAKAGIQLFQDVLDPGFRRGDDPRDFLREHQRRLLTQSSVTLIAAVANIHSVPVFFLVILNGLVRSRNSIGFVIPANQETFVETNKFSKPKIVCNG